MQVKRPVGAAQGTRVPEDRDHPEKAGRGGVQKKGDRSITLVAMHSLNQESSTL